MSELIIILKALGIVVLAIIGLAILIPLSFYLFEKRKTSRVYRQVEFSIGAILIMMWEHSWSSDESYLMSFWIISIMFFIFGNIAIWFYPLEGKSKLKRKEIKKGEPKK